MVLLLLRTGETTVKLEATAEVSAPASCLRAFVFRSVRLNLRRMEDFDTLPPTDDPDRAPLASRRVRRTARARAARPADDAQARIQGRHQARDPLAGAIRPGHLADRGGAVGVSARA